MKCYKCLELIINEEVIHGMHKQCFREMFNLSKDADFKNVVAKKTGSENENDQRVGSSFFHGKFRKYSASLDDKSYILKVQQEGYPELPIVEYICNQIARQLGIHVANFYFIKYENNLDTFVTENFMQFHIGNLVHIYHYLSSIKDYSCQNIIKIILEQTGRYTELKKFIYMVLFDSLIGNNDRHGRNIGIIETKAKKFLSPIYDNPSYLGGEIEALLGADHEPRGCIYVEGNEEPTMKDYVVEFYRLGHLEIVNDFHKKVVNNIQRISHLLENPFLSKKRKDALLRLIQKRLKEFNDEIK